ncbi:MAG: hypothetical protein AAF415_21045 [Pseudomonadota bacterium]
MGDNGIIVDLSRRDLPAKMALFRATHAAHAALHPKAFRDNLSDA